MNFGIWTKRGANRRAKPSNPLPETPVLSVVRDPDPVLSAIVAFRSAINIASALEAKKQHARTMDDRAIIDKANVWLRASGVGDSACRLFEATRHWPSWNTRDDWPKWNYLEVTEVNGSSSTGDESHVEFTKDNHRWSFTYRRSESHVNNALHATLALSFDGIEVMNLSIAKEFKEFDQWYPASIIALDVGIWAARLVELEALLHHMKAVRWADEEAARLSSQAARIKF